VFGKPTEPQLLRSGTSSTTWLQTSGALNSFVCRERQLGSCLRGPWLCGGLAAPVKQVAMPTPRLGG
jgi:hypothetical protein